MYNVVSVMHHWSDTSFCQNKVTVG